VASATGHGRDDPEAQPDQGNGYPGPETSSPSSSAARFPDQGVQSLLGERIRDGLGDWMDVELDHMALL
jgi:hypothetical protein